MPPVSLDKARAAKAQALAIFSRLGHVVGVGLTRIDKGYAIKVNLDLSELTGPDPSGWELARDIRDDIDSPRRPRD